MCVTDRHDMTLAVKVALNPNTTNQPTKTTIFSIQREIIITSLFRKLTKVLTNDFKTDITGISDSLAKILFLQLSLFINQLEILSHFTGSTLHLLYLKPLFAKAWLI